MGLTVKEVSEKLGVSAETLRYYERAGVIPPVTRTHSGIRDFSERDLAWVQHAKCMRAAGIPIDKLAAYQQLYSGGPATLRARLDLLLEQRQLLSARMAQLQETIDRLGYKISRYRRVSVKQLILRMA